MLNFFIGIVVGGIIGFMICAVFSINNSKQNRATPTPASEETGDSDARSK